MYSIRLTWAIALLLLLVSGAGIFWPAVYSHESNFVRPQMVAQDWFDLVLGFALPAVVLGDDATTC